MMAERGIPVYHSTIHRWIIRLVPIISKKWLDARNLLISFGRFMKPISKSKDNGITYIELLIQMEKLSIFTNKKS